MHWEFHNESVRYFNLSVKFIQWIKILYNDVHVKGRNENLTSREIPVQKGLNQGDCIPCKLYLIISQIFL